MSFFSLPLELRLEVYAYAIDLDTEPFINAAGLFLSCKEINREMEQEGKKLLRARYTKIQRDLSPGDGIIFDIPTSFRQLRHVRLSLSTNVYKPSWPHFPFHFCNRFGHLCENLQMLHELHLDSLTITFHEEDGVRLSEDNIFWVDMHVRTVVELGGAINAQKVIIHFPEFALGRFSMRLLGEPFEAYGSSRGEEWSVETGERTVVYKRTS